jgi:hypothetical protein
VARYGSIQRGTRQSALVALRSGQNEGSTAVAEGLITPDELRRITEDKEMELAREALEKRRKVNDERDHLRDAFMSQEIHPDVFERVSRVVKSAAERGEREVLVVRFARVLHRSRSRDQQLRARLARDSDRLRPARLRVLSKGAGAARVQAESPDHGFPRRRT